MLHEPGLLADVLSALWLDPDRLMAKGEMLKDGDRSTVVRLNLGAHRYVLKRSNLRGPAHTAAHSLMRSRARWSWRNARALLPVGIRVARPLACVEERWGLLRLRSWLLSEFVEGPSLEAVVERVVEAAGGLHDVAAAFGQLWRLLGRHRIACGDMKASNFIVADAGSLHLIDLDGMRFYREGPLWRRERRRDLDSFIRNWEEMPAVAAQFMARIQSSD